MNQLIATGSSYGALPNNEHAAIAIRRAIKKMKPCTIGGVLLFLTNGYANNPQAAIKEAIKAAGTLQVSGCCAMGLLTEEEWLLDVEGAVAMVFPNELAPQPLSVLQHQNKLPTSLLTISTPNAAKTAVNSTQIPQFGGICSDEFGHGPFAVWQSGRIVNDGFFHLGFTNNLASDTYVAESVLPLSDIQQVSRCQEHQVIEVGGQSAYENLLSSLPSNLKGMDLRQPYNLLCAISESDDLKSIKAGHYKLQHIISIDEKKQSIHLSGTIKQGRYIFWAIRNSLTAQKNMHAAVKKSLDHSSDDPKFALFFPNLGRGPEFYNGKDHDLRIFTESYPDTPLIGFYGNGEIAPGHQLAALIHRYSAAFTLVD